jgi:hypothetical protein
MILYKRTHSWSQVDPYLFTSGRMFFTSGRVFFTSGLMFVPSGPIVFTSGPIIFTSGPISLHKWAHHCSQADPREGTASEPITWTYTCFRDKYRTYGSTLWVHSLACKSGPPHHRPQLPVSTQSVRKPSPPASPAHQPAQTSLPSPARQAQ